MENTYSITVGNIDEKAIANVAKIENAALRKEAETLVALEQRAASNAVGALSDISAIRAEQAKIIYRIAGGGLIGKDKQYEKLSDLAEAIGLKPALVSQLKTSGSVYSDKKAPEAIKALPFTVIGQMGALFNDKSKREEVYKEATEHPERFSHFSQADAKAYVETHRKPVSKVTKRFTATLDGSPVECNGTPLATLDDWHDAFPADERFTIKADSNGNRREVTLHGFRTSLFVFREENAGKSGKVKKYTLADLLKMGIDPNKLVDLK